MHWIFWVIISWPISGLLALAITTYLEGTIKQMRGSEWFWAGAFGYLTVIVIIVGTLMGWHKDGGL